MLYRWQVTDPASMVRQHYEDGTLVFDGRSGLTHFLNLPAAEALELLAGAPLTADELADQLARRLATDGETVRGVAEEVIRRFDRIGLIEPVA